jgi:hypothetical protein
MKIRTILSVLGTIGAFLFFAVMIQFVGFCTVVGLDGLLRPEWEGEVNMGKAILLFSGMVTVVLSITLVAGLRAMGRDMRYLENDPTS